MRECANQKAIAILASGEAAAGGGMSKERITELLKEIAALKVSG